MSLPLPLSKYGDARAFLRVLKSCLTNSTYDLTQGGREDSYFDIDKLPSSDFNRLVDAITRALNRITRKEELRADKLAFIERDAGPLGLVAMRSPISLKTQLPTLVLRPRKRINALSVKGEPIRQGDRIAIISDVATSGKSIFTAAQVIWNQGGRVVFAFVVYDRLQGAAENLLRVDIPLFALGNSHSAPDVKARSPIRKHAYEVDFGGMAITR